MAYSSSSSNANSKVHTCSTECEQLYAQLKKLYDTQREQLFDASTEIQAYTQALKKVEAQLIAHQKNQLCQLSANDKVGFGHDGANESKVCETITSVSKVETGIVQVEVTKTLKPIFEKIEFINARNEIVRQAENPRKNNKSPRDYPIWEVIQKGNGPISVSIDTHGVIKVLPPKTAEEILARERERKARTTLLMALPEDHLAKFHKMTDAKEMWEAIKSRFSGNDELKKIQKYILKQQFKGFSVSNSEGLHKGYDRFQSLLSQLEIHGTGVTTEDANQKFLRSLPNSCRSQSI
ncbi:hypothetical protein Tco_0929960 [Tanacetum coccineum]